MSAVAALIALAALTALAALSACAVGPNYRTPATKLPAGFAAGVPLPDAATGSASIQSGPDLASWWRPIGDAELNSLVDRAVKSNFDIEVALTRLQQARTYEAVVVGHALPEADATASYGRGTGSDLGRGRSAQPLVSADDSAGLAQINTLAGFDSVWEIDIFGRYRRAFEAARFDAQAAAAGCVGRATCCASRSGS
jgi:outer membrane protein TolC